MVTPPARLVDLSVVDSYLAEYVLIGLSRAPRNRSRQFFAEVETAVAE
jgi:hypothetical protein